jgi:hypothetical protein
MRVYSSLFTVDNREDGSARLLQNIDNCLPNYTLTDPQKSAILITLMCELQLRQHLTSCFRTDVRQTILDNPKLWDHQSEVFDVWSLLGSYTGLLKMIVSVLTTCQTQYTWDRNICIFLLDRNTLQVFVTYLTSALYVHPLWFYKHQHDNRVRSKLFVACQRWWF